MTTWDLFERFNDTTEDNDVAQEVRDINDRYERWIDNVDFSGCKHSESVSTCATLNESRDCLKQSTISF